MFLSSMPFLRRQLPQEGACVLSHDVVVTEKNIKISYTCMCATVIGLWFAGDEGMEGPTGPQGNKGEEGPTGRKGSIGGKGNRGLKGQSLRHSL